TGGAGGKPCLHGFAQGAVHDGLLLANVNCAAVDNFTYIEPVSQEMRERADAEPNTPSGQAIAEGLASGADAPPVQILGQGSDRADFQVSPENQPDRLGFFGHDDELLLDARIAEGDRSTDPDALALGGRDLVADALADHLTLELGEG